MRQGTESGKVGVALLCRNACGGVSDMTGKAQVSSFPHQTYADIYIHPSRGHGLGLMKRKKPNQNLAYNKHLHECEEIINYFRASNTHV